ncbi:MAG: molybdenum cofactor guanylyltransferase MobA [Hyphomicrobiaceae bacterium]|nr:molybdenum cofactor guanylyltransferase MobA [Hyphomicrobiaceae bacterium]
MAGSLVREAMAGVLLAGGQSRRMGGGDKGLLVVGGKPMMAHVVERLAPQVGTLVVNANGDPARFADFGLPVVADTIEGHVGPLAGVLAGMRWCAARAAAITHVATVSTDAPLVPDDLVARFVGALEASDARIAMAASGGHIHPVIGLWPVALADDLEAALRGGLRKVLDWTDRHGSTIVPFEFVRLAGREVDPFFNANTPEEFAELRDLLGEPT